MHHPSLGLGNGLLALFNFGVVKLFHLAARCADEVVVVLAFVQLIDGFAAFEIAANQNAGLFELREHAVHGGQAYVRAVVQQHPKDIFRRHVALCPLLKDLQNLEAGKRGFEAGALEFVDIGHGVLLMDEGLRHRVYGGSRYNRLIISSALLSMPDKARCNAPLGLVFLIGASVAALAGCGSFDGASNRIAGIVKPYKVDVVQGNFVSREQVQALQPGMSRQQVRDILGTPLVTSLFHGNRWEYVFTLKRAGDEIQTRKLTVYFTGDVLERSEGDEMPTESEFVATLGAKEGKPKVPVLEATPEQLSKFPAPAKAAASAPQAPSVPLPSSYPPLEAPSR